MSNDCFGKSISKQRSSAHLRYADWSSFTFNRDKPTPESISPETQKQHIEALLDAVNSSSHHVRNFYISFLLIGLYIAIIIWSTTDMMLLKETPVNLPLLNVELPITGFYTFAPYFYLLLHFNLLLQLCLLSDKLHRFDHAVAQLPGNEARKYYATQLFPFAFSYTLSGRQHSAVLKFLLTVMVWVTVIWLPLCLLIGLQVGFLAYHSSYVVMLQRWAIMADLVFLTFFWPIIRTPDGKGFSWIMRASGLYSLVSWVQRRFFARSGIRLSAVLGILNPRNGTKPSGRPMIEGSLSLVTLTAVIAFSWGVAVLPDSANEKRVGQWIWAIGTDSWLSRESSKQDGHRYFRLTEWLFDETMANRPFGDYPVFHRNLRLREQLLIANLLAPEDQVGLTDEDMKVREQALKKTIGLSLGGRDLRYADFSESVMPKVDFRRADLRYARFPNTTLSRARMTLTQIQGTDLRNSKLESANLKGALLEGTILENANLREVNLENSNLERANLSNAKLNHANLVSAKLNRTILNSADLQDTNLENAIFNGAVLIEANLQRASLKNARFDGADLRGADLSCVELQNGSLKAANMRGVDLHGTNLLNTRLDGTDLRIANLRNAELGSKDKYTSTNEPLPWKNTRFFTSAVLNLSNITATTFNAKSISKCKKVQNIPVNSPSLSATDIIQEIPEEILTLAKNWSAETGLGSARGDNIWIEEPDKALWAIDFIWTPSTGYEREQPYLGNHYEGFKSRSLTQLKFVRDVFNASEGRLKFAESEAIYHKKLEEYFIHLSCEDLSVALGIIEFRIDSIAHKARFAKCLLTLKDKKDKSGQLVCPGVSEINNEALEMLEEMASIKELKKNKIQPTFKCRRMES